MIQHGRRHSRRPDERQLIDVEVDRQVHLAVGAGDVGRQELGLQIDQLIIMRKLAGAHIE